MDGSVSLDEQVEAFRHPGQFLADLDPETTGRIIAAAADVALVVEEGVIRDIALSNEELCREGYSEAWRDRPWIETVTVESRQKIEDLLGERSAGQPRWRQVNHPSPAGLDLPVRYTALRAGGDRIVALGRELRETSRLQQRLVEVQQSLERDYARMREAEARYQLLFDAVPQPLLIVEPQSLRVAEANPAAARCFGRPVGEVVGARLDELFGEDSRAAVAGVVAESALRGEALVDGLFLPDGSDCSLSASAVRHESGARVIARVGGEASEAAKRSTGASRRDLLQVLEDLPDGLVVAGSDHRIRAVNRAFVEMAHLASETQISGAHLGDHLGRSRSEVGVLFSALRNHGVVRNFATVLRDRFGNEEEVEISAVATPRDEASAFGFSVRSVARKLRTQQAGTPPGTADRLTELVGRVPLKEIVRESTDFIEKLCIEAALEITHDNRVSAAEMLGLSRQSLYAKMKRFEMNEAGSS